MPPPPIKSTVVTMPPPPYKKMSLSEPKPPKVDSEILVDEDSKPILPPVSTPAKDSLDFDVEHSGAILPLPPVEPVDQS